MCIRFEGRYRMRFKICKLGFTGAVHFGEGGLATSGDTLMADTIYAALCQEAALQGSGLLEKLVEYTSAGRLLISDALPYVGGILYVPKPVVEVAGGAEGDSSVKKALKKLRYIPIDKLDMYLRGGMDIAAEAVSFHDGFSMPDLIEKVKVPEDEVTRPYAVAIRRYRKGSGLYLCVGYEGEEEYSLFSGLLELLAYSGIGGERSSGYGRFETEWVSLEANDDGSPAAYASGAEDLLRRLRMADAEKYMSLSVCLPAEEELDDVISGADYLTVRRGGWVSSATYADAPRKKRDIYMLAAGAVFGRRFSGGIYDVSEGGRHPVYRYGKPMLIGIG